MGEQEESAVGFSLYPDPLIDAGLGAEDDADRRIFLPLGHDPALAASLRADDWQTVAALSESDDARARLRVHSRPRRAGRSLEVR